MKAKTIKAILRKKHAEWIATIKDEDVRALAKKNTIITGGCIASMLLREPVNDYDLYFRDLETVKALTGYYVAEFNRLNPTGKWEEPDPAVQRYSRVPVPAARWHEERIKSADGPDILTGRIKINIKSAGIASERENTEGYSYFESQDAGSTAAAEYVESVVKVVDDNDGKKEKYRPVFLSSNAITLSNDVQLVIRFYGEPDVIHENYDFVHCMNVWDSNTGNLTLNPDALESLLSKELRYVGSKYPLCSIIRTRKFVARQWTINAGQYVKMAFHLAEHDLNDPAVLEEQLTGVDIHYFFEVIEALKERDSKRVDTAYLMEVIDKIF